MPEDDSGESYYYDANTLDYNKKTVGEIIKNNKQGRKSVVSHLSLGEAYANAKIKGEDKGVDLGKTFTDLVGSLDKLLTIVQLDGIEGELAKTREILPALSITDAIHVAVAIKYKCSVIRTTDPDLYNAHDRKVKELGAHFSMPNFCISRME